ncbi:sel1 repeat family protein [Pelomyxa schiedti]|nr:sel1 repeat family protein [Pelomyxa schiedti]
MARYSEEWSDIVSREECTRSVSEPGWWAHKLYVAVWTTFTSKKISCEPLWLELSTRSSEIGSGSEQVPQLLSSSSLVLLGVCCKAGICGLVKDPNRALCLLQRAADAGNSMAENALGVCLDYGSCGYKDAHQAVSHYRRAAESGNTKAMFNLGISYKNGTGVDKDLNQAAMLCRKAADAGNSSAMLQLSLCYDNGRGVEKDTNQALQLLMRAAEAGDSTAQFNLGCRYGNGQKGVDRDLKKEVSLYRRAAAGGNESAILNLGFCYHNGEGVRKDMTRALSFYRRAADAGIPAAFFSLGVYYHHGFGGLDKDDRVAVSLYRRAANGGHVTALFNLGVCYENGNGVEIDKAQAVSHYFKAANAGLPNAIFALGECYRNGCGVQKDTRTAVSFYKLAAEKNFKDALDTLATLLSGKHKIPGDQTNTRSSWAAKTMSGESEVRSGKIVIVGDTAVGKTCLLVTYINGSFPSDYIPTVFDNYSTFITVDDRGVNIALWDTVALEDYDSLRPLSYPNTDVFLICFSLDSADSLESVVNKWAPEVKHHCPDAAIMLVGTKSDLGTAGSTKGQSGLSPEVVAQMIGARSYNTCSARNQQGLGDVFSAAARVVLKKQ